MARNRLLPSSPSLALNLQYATMLTAEQRRAGAAVQLGVPESGVARTAGAPLHGHARKPAPR